MRRIYFLISTFSVLIFLLLSAIHLNIFSPSKVFADYIVNDAGGITFKCSGTKIVVATTNDPSIPVGFTEYDCVTQGLSCHKTESTTFCTTPRVSTPTPTPIPASHGANEYCTKHSDCPDGEFCISNAVGQKGSSSCVPIGAGGPNSICEDYTAQGYGVNSVCASGVCGTNFRCTGTSASPAPQGPGGGESGPGNGGQSNGSSLPVVNPLPTTDGYCAKDDRSGAVSQKPDNSSPSCGSINNTTYNGEGDAYCQANYGGNFYFYQCNSASTSTSPTPSAGPEQQACQYHNGVKSYGGGFCGTDPKNVQGFDAAKAASGGFCKMTYYDQYTCNDGTVENFATPNGSSLCSQDPWCPALGPTSGGGSGNSGGGSTTASDCANAATFLPPTNGNLTDNNTATQKCNATPGCFTSVGTQGQTAQCLPSVLKGPSCGGGFCQTNSVCVPAKTLGTNDYCAKPQELGQNCGPGYGLDNPDCDASQNLTCTNSHTCQYGEGGAPTPTPGVSIYKGGLGTACPSGGGCGYYQGNPLGCYPAVNGSLNDNKTWVCSTGPQTWCTTSNSQVSSPSQCKASSGGTSTTYPVSTPTPAPGSLSYQADCPSVSVSNVCGANNTCPEGYTQNTVIGPGGTNGNQACNYFEGNSTGWVCCMKQTGSSAPAVTSPPTPTPVRPTAVPTQASVTPIPACGNSNNVIQGNLPCNIGTKTWHYVPEPTLSATEQHVSGCNDQFPYQFSCY